MNELLHAYFNNPNMNNVDYFVSGGLVVLFVLTLVIGITIIVSHLMIVIRFARWQHVHGVLTEAAKQKAVQA